MKLLVIDTSTNSSSVALTENGLLCAEWLVNPETTHSAALLRSLDLVLEGAGFSLDAIDALGGVVSALRGHLQLESQLAVT